jgi:alanine racemase
VRTTHTPTSSTCDWHASSTPCARPASIPGSSTSPPPPDCWPGALPSATPCAPGALYGLLPSWASSGDRDPGLQPALSLRALPLRIFDLPAGEAIGYGLRFRATRNTRIATLGIGYGDGWPRIHANNGHALVRGRDAPMVGAISMDGLTVDLTGIDGVTYGDEFVLIGEQGGARITADDVAAERRTINYEVTTALRDRLPRLHRGAA